MELFSITCQTCEARLKVRNRQAIGQILACPKCESMVQVVPPPGWIESTTTEHREEEATAAAAAIGAASQSAAHAVTPPGNVTHPAPNPDNGVPQNLADTRTASADSLAPDGGSNITGDVPVQSVRSAWTSPAELAGRKAILWATAGGALLVGVALTLGFLLAGGGEDEVARGGAPALEQESASAPFPADDPVDMSEPEALPSEADPSADSSSSPELLESEANDHDRAAPTASAEPAGQPTSGDEAQASSDSPDTIAEQATTSAGPRDQSMSSADSPADVGQPRRSEAPVAASGQADAPAQTATPDDTPPADPVAADNSTATSGADKAVAELDFHLENAAPAGPPPVIQRHASPSDSSGMSADAEGALEMIVPSIQATDIPLVELVDVLAATISTPISIDLGALQSAGMAPTVPCSVAMEESPVAEVLTAALQPLGLTHVVRQNQIVVTIEDRDVPLQDVMFRADDLTQGDSAAAGRLAELVQDLVAPHTWESAGGDGTIQIRDEALAVTQTRPVQYDILVLIEKLRVARDLPRRSRLGADRFELHTKRAAVGAALQRPASLMFPEPVPLVEVLNQIAKTSGLTVVADWRALATRDFAPTTFVSCAIHDRPLGEVLDAILGPLDLSWRVFDRRTLQIATVDAVQDQLDIEFHSLATLIAAGRDPQRLIAELKTATGHDTWDNSGGAGRLHFDAPSGCLIVRQTQPMQEAVALWLASAANAQVRR
ncbi:MAG: hypothetical protein WDZ59_02810 [Pirellulales bacterium]